MEERSFERVILDGLVAYLAGETSLEAFRAWFAAILWDVELSDNPEVETLAYEIEIRLAEHYHGDWTEIELREILQLLTIRSSVN